MSGGSGGYEVASPSNVVNINSTLTVNSGVSANAGDFFNLSGNISGAGTLTVTGVLTWTGDLASGGGITGISAGGALIISRTSSEVVITTYTLNNRGTITWQGAGDLRGRLDAFINNLEGGLFNIHNDQHMYVAGGDGGGFFNNSGTVRKSQSTGRTVIGGGQGFTFNNNGTVEVQTGNLHLSDSLTPHNSSGAFLISSGALLEFGGGIHNMSPTSSVSGAGTVGFVGGTVNIAGSYDIPTTVVNGGTANFNGSASVNARTDNVTISAGTYGGSGVITVTNSLMWTGGTLNGDHSTTADFTNLPVGATMTISRTGESEMYGYGINNRGTVIWQGAGALPRGFQRDLQQPARRAL